MSSVKTFQNVRGLHPGRSMFDLSYEKKFTCDMGQLIPVMCDEVVPGDKFMIGNQAVIRFMPLVAPILHEINMYVHYFFVPYRLLWNVSKTDSWEAFITGGVTGNLTPTIPRWAVTPTTGNAIGTLWDYLGFPTGVVPVSKSPLDFPRRAYNFIFNEYYRDETLITEVALTNELILNRCWEKDYFTSSLPWQQRGTAPALPISGTTHAVWPIADFVNGAATGPINLTVNGSAGVDNHIYANDAGGEARDNVFNVFNHNTIDLSTASTFDIADLRLAFQIQKWMERNARSGARYTEFLLSHYGVSPRDDRLQRPEYIGGSKAPIIISEVLQTSETATTPQGNLAGHGITVSDAFCGKYHAKEFGLIMGIMSVMPRAVYNSQGINRQWLRSTKFDFYSPEFANLSEQEIFQGELVSCIDDTTQDDVIFGYQGRYDELRTKNSMSCSLMRTTLDYWHLAREFVNTDGNTPQLNETFVKCVPRKDIFAAPSEPGLLVSFGNVIKAFRPLPIQAEPGLIDHNGG